MGIIRILAWVLSILVTLKFIRDLYGNNELGGFWIVTVKALWSMFFILYCLCGIMNNINEYSWIFEYTIIPFYLIIQFFLCILMSSLVVYLGAIIKILYNKCVKKNFSLYLLKNIYLSIISITTEFGQLRYLKKLINFLNEFFNPILGVKIIYSRFIKVILTISYLIAGIIVLSPMNNYLYNELSQNNSIDNKEVVMETVKRDYDTYKSIFVISLIPFSLNYLMNKGK